VGAVRIVTDSNADIPPEIASRLGISVVPNYVYFGQEVVRDGFDMAPQAFFNRMAASSIPPRTTHPPVIEFLDAYQHALNGSGSDSVVSIHVASTLSGTINSAQAAAQMLPDPSQVEIIDSKQLSMALGWVVIQAAELARKGASRSEVVELVGSLLPRMRAIAIIDTLEHLVRGGRISHLSATLGTLLQIKPILTIQDGQALILDRVRTRARAMERLIGHVQTWGPMSDLVVMHARADEPARELAERLQASHPGRRILVAPLGAALTAHFGLGAVGACGPAATDR
jgi:DegV family protein with EDD domain